MNDYFRSFRTKLNPIEITLIFISNFNLTLYNKRKTELKLH